MAFYQESFPTATVIPKMHTLEEHVVPWLKEWYIGFGMMGGQGAESIHAYFNRLGKMFDVMPDWVQRLKHKMKEHLLHVAPANIAAKPVKKKNGLLLITILFLLNYVAVYTLTTLSHAYPLLILCPQSLIHFQTSWTDVRAKI